MVRVLLTVIALLGTSPGCAKKRSQVLTADGASLRLPAGTDTAKVSITVVPGATLPDVLQRTEAAINSSFHVLKVVQLTPDALEVAGADLTVKLEAPLAPPLELSHVVAIGADAAGNVTTLPVMATPPDQLTIKLSRLSHVVLLVPVPGTTMLGTPGLIVRGATEPLLSPQCSSWITPDSAAVAALAKDPAKLVIDTKTGIQLDSLTIRDRVDEPAQSLRAEEILKSGTADRVNASIVLASLLLARGYPVRLVAGDVTLKTGEQVSKGFHQWVETVIDNASYYVDVTVPKGARLIPLAEATTTFALAVHRSCAKYPPGVTGDPFGHAP